MTSDEQGLEVDGYVPQDETQHAHTYTHDRSKEKRRMFKNYRFYF